MGRQEQTLHGGSDDGGEITWPTKKVFGEFGTAHYKSPGKQNKTP